MSNQHYIQASQKCMRCDGFLLASQDVTSDPNFKGCVSHSECIAWEDKGEENQTQLEQTNNNHYPSVTVQNNNTSTNSAQYTLRKQHESKEED